MAIGVKRKRIHGISIEETYGSGEATAEFALPALEFDYTPTITQGRNTSMYGSNYELNDVINDVRMTNFSIRAKVSEDIVPLLFSSAFSISSTTVSGETAVFQHTLTYANTSTGNSFTLFVEDDDRGSEYIAGCRFNNITLETVRGDYLQMSIEGVGKFPQAWGGDVTLAYRQEFASRNLSMQYEPEGSGFSGNADVINATINHIFNLAGDEDNFDLGSEELDRLLTTTHQFTSDITAVYPDHTIRDQFEDGEYRGLQITVLDTGRVITGSTESTNPLLRFTQPSTRITTWAEEGSANDILKQTFTLEALNKIGIADAPETIFVVNAIEDYAVTA